MNAIATTDVAGSIANSAPTMNSESKSGDRAIEDLQQHVEDEQLRLVQRGQQVRAAVLEVIVVRLRQDPFMDFHRELVAETKHERMGRPDELDPHYRSHDRNGGEQAGRRNQHVPVRLGAEGGQCRPDQREFPGSLGFGEHGKEGHHRREGCEFRDCAREH